MSPRGRLVAHEDRVALLRFFGWTFGITWLAALPLIAERFGWLGFDVPGAVHYLVPLGPLAGALIASASAGDRGAQMPDMKVTWRWRIPLAWWGIAGIAPLIALLLAVLGTRVVAGAWPDLGGLAEVPYLGEVGALPALAIWIATFGVGEEAGWRGFAMPVLQRRLDALTSTLALVPFWALWHAPMFLYHDPFIAMGLAGSIGWLAGLTFGAAFLTWLLNSTGGSVFVCALFHGTYNFAVSSSATEGSIAAVVSALVVVGVVFIVRSYGREHLAPRPRFVGL